MRYRVEPGMTRYKNRFFKGLILCAVIHPLSPPSINLIKLDMDLGNTV
jgi:ubiquitin-protein ligase